MSVPFEIIEIKWRAIVLGEKDKFPKGNCLYQAYGDSMIYGRNQLLYIGKTNDLQRRVDDHTETDFARILNCTLIAGEITDYKMGALNRSEEQILRTIESILICYTKPSYNSSNIKDIGSDNVNTLILIHNTGERGLLPLECSNYWWHDKLIPAK